MKSSIKIDFVDNGKGLEPVLQVIIDGDDTRDSLLKTFFQSLGGLSQWLRVDFNTGNPNDLGMRKYITVYPVKPDELEKEGTYMVGQSKHLIKENNPT